MTPAAASASAPPAPALAFLVLLAVLAAGGYAAWCAAFPFKRCKHCEGNGKTRRRGRSPRRGWKTCPRCKGNGMRLRAGRRIFHTAATASDNRERTRRAARLDH